MIINEMPGLALGTSTASADTILDTYTAYDGNGDLITGSMPNKGAWNSDTIGDDNVIIPAGYHNGSGYVSGRGAYKNGFFDGENLARVGTAKEPQVLTGYSFTNTYYSGIGGSMVNQGAGGATLNCGESYAINEGYYDGTGVVTANSLASQTVGNATAASILNGYTAWANGTLLTGTAKKFAYTTVTLTSTDDDITFTTQFYPSNFIASYYYTDDMSTNWYSSTNNIFIAASYIDGKGLCSYVYSSGNYSFVKGEPAGSTRVSSNYMWYTFGDNSLKIDGDPRNIYFLGSSHGGRYICVYWQ